MCCANATEAATSTSLDGLGMYNAAWVLLQVACVRDGPVGFLMERERERVQFPFPFPFLSFRSGVRYYRSRVRSLSVPVSVPGVCSFFLEQIWNRPVPVTVITVPVTVPTRSRNRSGSVPGFRSGHLVTQWNGSCDGPVLVSVITVPGPVPGPFLVRSCPRSG